MRVMRPYILIATMTGMYANCLHELDEDLYLVEVGESFCVGREKVETKHLSRDREQNWKECARGRL